jgi:hypothetical protein
MPEAPTKDEQLTYDIGGKYVDYGQFARQLWEKDEDFYEPIWHQHDDDWNFFRGHQWRTYRRYGAMVVFNIIGPHIRIIAANLTDNEILPQTSPKGPDADNMSEVFDEVLRIAHEQDDSITKDHGLLIQALVKGYAVAKIGHDSDRAIPVTYEIVNPRNFMAEPGVPRPDEDSHRFWHFEWMTAREIRELWPDKWDKIKMGPLGSEDGTLPNSWDYERGGDPMATNGCLVRELWLKTDETEPIPEDVTAKELEGERAEIMRLDAPRVVLEQNHPAHLEDHQAHKGEIEMEIRELAAQMGAQGREVPEEEIQEALRTNPLIIELDTHIEEHLKIQPGNPRGERERFNGWRHSVFAGCDFYPLEDEASPYTDEEGRGRHPFVFMKSADTATDIYCPSLLNQCIDLQETVNRWMSKFEDHLSLCANPMLCVDVTRINHRPNQIKAMAGLLVSTIGKPEDVMYWLQPPQISNQLIQNFYQIIRQIELVTGVSDAELGIYPRMERASQPMIQQITENSRARWRAYQREYKQFKKRCAKEMLLRIQQFMTQEMQIMVGRTKDKMRWVNLIQQGGQVRYDMTQGQYDVQVELKPLAAQTEDAVLARALQLGTMPVPPYNLPMLDRQGVADMTRDPVLRESVQRIDQKEQRVAEMTAQKETTGET